jgi:HlyD family secretion protein
MDVPKPKKTVQWRPRVLIVGAGMLVAAIALGSSLWSRPNAQYKVKREDLLVGAVQRGELQVAVDGYGVLRSDKQVLITALTDATVDEVLLRSGAKVEPGSVILKLSNPEVMREVELAAIALSQEEADLRRLTLSNKRELLAEQSVLAELRSNHQVLHLRNEAQKELAASGVVSKLDYQTSLLQEQLLLERVEFQNKRIERLQEVARESQNIKREEINRAKATHENARQRAESLTVRADLNGTLQRMPAELGQGIKAGQELALVGSDQDLRALIRVSQSRADKLQIGQAAQINTRREKVAGVITRIAPEVRDGTIEVEIKFKDGVPPSARPELNVDARILVATLRNALFIERPPNVQGGGRGNLFQLGEDGRRATLRTVSFGEESGRYIQLLSGARTADRFVLSDVSRFRDAKVISIVD